MHFIIIDFFVLFFKHPQDVLLPNEKGIAVMPNTRTVIGMETNQLSRMGYPYPSDCVAHWNETAYPYQHQTLNYTQLVICHNGVKFFMNIVNSG